MLLGGLVVMATIATLLSQTLVTSTSNQSSGTYTQFSQQLANTTATIAPTPLADLFPPSVGQVSPTSVSAGNNAFFASATDDTGIVRCDLYWNGAKEGPMGLTGSTTSVTAEYSMYVSGSASNVYANCTDVTGKYSTGTPVSVAVSGGAPTSSPSLIISSVWTQSCPPSGTGTFVYANVTSSNGALTPGQISVSGTVSQNGINQTKALAYGSHWLSYADNVECGGEPAQSYPNAYQEYFDGLQNGNAIVTVAATAAGYAPATTTQTLPVYGATDTPPQYSSINLQCDIMNCRVKIWTQWSDNSALSGYVFSANAAPGFSPASPLANSSWVQFGSSNLSSSIGYVNLYDFGPANPGNQFNFAFYANDSSNGWNGTGVYSRTLPPGCDTSGCP